MRTAFKILVICFVFCGLFLGALNSKNPVPMQLTAFAFLVICIWRYDRRRKRASQRKMAEWQFLAQRRRMGEL
jgi:hypothetical protein